MATDWPGHLCYLHWIGPGIPCVADRFYPNTDCHPPPFFFFQGDTTQTEGVWLWLNSTNWMEWRIDFKDNPRWYYERYLTTINSSFQLRYFDNPDYPSASNFPFRCQVTLGARKTIIAGWTRFRYEVDFGYSTTVLDRHDGWIVTSASWTRLIPNDPTIGKPLGNWTILPKLCQPGWTSTQSPR